MLGKRFREIIKKYKPRTSSKKNQIKTTGKSQPKKKTEKIETPLQKFEENPIIEPNQKNSWESKATFNPAALYKNGMVHLLYRAIGDSDISVLGYASSEDGITIKEKLAHPAYFQNNVLQRTSKNSYSLKIAPVLQSSGGGSWGGCEDPRLTLIEDTVYLTYTAFDGWSSLRMAISSIKLRDFLKKKWDWTKPILFSPPGEISKNWILFPEKIKGKFAVLHSINPRLSIDYFDNLENFDDRNYIRSTSGNRIAPKSCDSIWLRSSGPPPIKTKKGWLLICHIMDVHDPNKYKLGAMLLDLKDPCKIVAECKKPILEPDECYENEGWKSGVAYCCGAIVKKDELFVYYGGADTVCCGASVNLNEFLDELIKTGAPKLKRVRKLKLFRKKNKK